MVQNAQGTPDMATQRSADLRNVAVRSEEGSLWGSTAGGGQGVRAKGVNGGSHKEKMVLEQRQSHDLSLPPALRALACGKDLHLFGALQGVINTHTFSLVLLLTSNSRNV